MPYISSGISIDPDEARRVMRKETYDLSARIRPIGDKCCVLLDPRVREVLGTSLDLALPDLCQDPPTTGQVVAVGPRCEAVRVGDRVAFGKHNGRSLGEGIALELGFKPDELVVMRPVLHDPSKPVTSDEIIAILDL